MRPSSSHRHLSIFDVFEHKQITIYAEFSERKGDQVTGTDNEIVGSTIGSAELPMERSVRMTAKPHRSAIYDKSKHPIIETVRDAGHRLRNDRQDVTSQRKTRIGAGSKPTVVLGR